MRWSICAKTEQDARNAGFCTASTRPVMITAKLLPQDMSERAGLAAENFGVALPNNQVYVLFDRVQRITKDSDLSRPLVLGHIIAHELGHVLLVGEGHFARGIMSERLMSAQCERPGVMRLAFTPEQAERMRAQIGRLTNVGSE